MMFPSPLLRGTFLRRYKRFFADVRLDSGEIITAATPNTGAMLTCSEPGSPACVSIADNPKRKLKYTWELVKAGKTWVGVNTHLANHLAREAIEAGLIPELAGYAQVRREVKYGANSRVDLLLEDGAGPPCYVEVKNVSMGVDGVASFPDAVSIRAVKHMVELAAQVRAGNRAAVLFTVQRGDCSVFRPADGIHPEYGQALREAVAAGVMALAYRAKVTTRQIRLVRPLPVEL